MSNHECFCSSISHTSPYRRPLLGDVSAVHSVAMYTGYIVQCSTVYCTGLYTYLYLASKDKF